MNSILRKGQEAEGTGRVRSWRTQGATPQHALSSQALWGLPTQRRLVPSGTCVCMSHLSCWNELAATTSKLHSQQGSILGVKTLPCWSQRARGLAKCTQDPRRPLRRMENKNWFFWGEAATILLKYKVNNINYLYTLKSDFPSKI